MKAADAVKGGYATCEALDGMKTTHNRWRGEGEHEMPFSLDCIST